MMALRKLGTKKAAFTLFEVLLAMGILVVAVSVIANLEMRSLMRVLTDRDELEKIFIIKKAQLAQFLRLHKEQKKMVTKLEEPEIKITSQVSTIHPKSTLASLKHRLFLLRTTGVWKYERVHREASLVTFIMKYEPKKSKEGQEKKV